MRPLMGRPKRRNLGFGAEAVRIFGAQTVSE